MENFALDISGRYEFVDADPNLPLLRGIRGLLNMTATKYSCGIERCGASAVHIDGYALRSCQVPGNCQAQFYGACHFQVRVALTAQ